MQGTEGNTSITTISPALISAIRRILRPLVKLMLAKGVTYNYLIDIIKQVFVEVADKGFWTNGKPSTDSYLSLLTGVHRKDIKRLRPGIYLETETIPETVSLGARLVSLWASEARYLDKNNRPKPLPRFIKEGGGLSFEGLVTSVCSDIRSRVVLDEWLRLGVVHFDNKHRVCLNVDAFVPAEGFNEKAYYFGHNLSDHTAAAASNLLGENQAFLERCVHYDELSENSIKILAKQSELLGMQSLLAVIKMAMELKKKDALVSDQRHRMTLGIYFFSEQIEPQMPVTDTNTSGDEMIAEKATTGKSA